MILYRHILIRVNGNSEIVSKYLKIYYMYLQDTDKSVLNYYLVYFHDNASRPMSSSPEKISWASII